MKRPAIRYARHLVVGVRLPAGETGYIPKDQLERFLEENPEGQVIQVDTDGQNPVGVQFEWQGQMCRGYIPADQVARFKRDHPDALVNI
jgi:hypothetical protein